jgi:hypothetical protein
MRQTGWSDRKFGTDAATALAKQLPLALQAAHSRALAAHQAGGLSSNDAYGGVLALAQHEEIVDRASEIAGATVHKPPRSRYKLLMANGALIFPWRYASDLSDPLSVAQLRRPVSQLRQDLFALGPEPTWQQPTLEEDEEEAADRAERAHRRETLLEALTALEASLVVVAYASNPRAGILDIQWGDAALLDHGYLEWRHVEPLPVTTLPMQANYDHSAIEAASGTTSARAFNEAPLSDLVLGTKPPLAASE